MPLTIERTVFPARDCRKRVHIGRKKWLETWEGPQNSTRCMGRPTKQHQRGKMDIALASCSEPLVFAVTKHLCAGCAPSVTLGFLGGFHRCCSDSARVLASTSSGSAEQWTCRFQALVQQPLWSACNAVSLAMASSATLQDSQIS